MRPLLAAVLLLSGPALATEVDPDFVRCAQGYTVTISGSPAALTLAAQAGKTPCGEVKVVGWEAATGGGRYEDATKAPYLGRAEGERLALAMPDKPANVRPLLSNGKLTAPGSAAMLAGKIVLPAPEAAPK